MAYVDPDTIFTPDPGDVLPAAWLDTVRDDLQWIVTNAPKCRGTRATVQTITNVTATAVLFTAESYDVGGMHSTTTNTSRFTVPAGGGGFYRVTAYIVWESDATGWRSVTIRANGTTDIVADSRGAVNGSQTRQTVSAGDIFLSAGDYIEVVVYEDGVATLDVEGAACTIAWGGAT